MSPVQRNLVAAAVFCFVFTNRAITAQVPDPGIAASAPVPGAGHHYIGNGAETVNPADGSLSFDLPLDPASGRGLSSTFGIRYNGNEQYFPSNGCSYNAPCNSGSTFGWHSFWEFGYPAYQIESWGYRLPILTAQTSLFWTGYIWQQSQCPDSSKGFPVTNGFQCQNSCYGNNNYVFQGLTGPQYSLPLGSVFNDPQNTNSSFCPLSPNNVKNPGNNHGILSKFINATTTTVSDQAGTTYTFPTGSGSPGEPAAPNFAPRNWGVLASSITDRNGNTVVLNPTGNGYIDTAGRTAVSWSGLGNAQDQITVAGLGTNVIVKWGTTTMTFPETFKLVGGSNTCTLSNSATGKAALPGYATPTYSEPVITEIDLPNGQKYSFQYDGTYGKISQINFPDGGYARYTWGLAPKARYAQSTWTIKTSDSTSTGSCQIEYDIPAITDRYVSFDGQSEVLHQHFTYATTWSGNQWTGKTTTMTTNDEVTGLASTTVYTYSSMGVDPSPYGGPPIAPQVPVEKTVQYEDGSGVVLKTVNKAWNSVDSIAAEQTILDGGLSNATLRCYDANEQTTGVYEYGFIGDSGTPTSFSAPSCTSVPSWFTTASIGGLRRQTLTTYDQFFVPSDSTVNPGSYSGTHIVDAPLSVVVKDGNGAQVKSTAFTYDSPSTLQASQAMPSTLLSPPGASRGNITSMQRAIGASSSATTTYQYWDTGQVYSITAPCGASGASCPNTIDGSSHTTYYDYHDSYSSGTASGQTFAYLTAITDPRGHVTKYTWGYNDGLIRSMADPNVSSTSNNTATYSYETGGLKRLTKIATLDGGQTLVSYDDSTPNPSMTVCKLLGTGTGGVCPVTGASAGNWMVTQSLRDGMGHVVQTKLTSDPVGNVYTNTKYTGSGAVYEQANPTRCLSSPGSFPGTCSEPTWGRTDYTYDALGRKIQLTHQPDGASAFWSYSGPTTTATDENGNDHKQTVDGLGRLVAVKEPNGTTSTASMVMTYGYDTADNLLTVSQAGDGTLPARNRYFAYDQVGRLVASFNPENQASVNYLQAGATYMANVPCSGWTTSGASGPWTNCYSYDLNGNVVTRTDNRQVSVTHYYDTENRVVKKAYSDGTPTDQFAYDGKDETGAAIAGETYPIHHVTKSINKNGATVNAAAQYYYSDPLGRITKKSSCIPGDCNWDITVQAAYDSGGDLIQLTNGSPLKPITFTYGYNGAAQLQSLTSSWSDSLHPLTLLQANSTSSTSPSYSPAGGIMNATFGLPSGSQSGKATEVKAYDSRMRVSSNTLNGSSVLLTSPTGSVSLSGGEQTKVIPATSGSGSFSISGVEQSTTITVGCGPYGQTCQQSIYDGGSIQVTVNGFSASVSWNSNDTSATIAGKFATALNVAGSPVTAGNTTGSNVVSMQAKATGAGTNYSFTANTVGWNTQYFSTPSFSPSPTSSALTGGVDGNTFYDTGNISVTVNGVTASTTWGQGDTPISVASKLSTAMNGVMSGFLSAGSNNTSVVTVTSKSTQYWPISTSTSDTNTGNFSSSSFSAQGNGMNGSTSSEAVYAYNISYDPAGNIGSFSDSVVGNWNFAVPSSVGAKGYDTLNRLVAGQATSGPYAGQYACWTYDAFGNRKMEAVSATACNGNPTATSWATYTSSNQVNGTNFAAAGHIHDAAGDVINDGRNQYLFDGAGRICAVRNISSGSVTEYVYDAEGSRVAKGTLSAWPSACPAATSGNGFTLTAQYIVGLGGEQLGEHSVSGGTASWKHTNIFVGGGLSATYTASNTFFDLPDWLGTKRVELGADGCLTSWLALPYGNDINSGNTPRSQAIGNTPLCSDPNDTEHHFTGKERDSESGNDYFEARYYSSAMGRFMSPDWSAKEEPVPYAKLDDPQSLNLYAYVENNPLFRTDPDGHCCWDEFKDFMNGASGAYIGDEGAGRMAPDVPSRGAGTAGALLGHSLALAQSGLELVVGTAAAVGGGGEAVATSPAALTGVGAVVPAAGAAVAVAGAALDAHGAVTGAKAAGSILAMALNKSKTGPGSVPKEQRAKQRVASDKERTEMRKEQGGNCAHCDKPLNGDEVSHHYPERHADGGTEQKLVHSGCHAELHGKC